MRLVLKTTRYVNNQGHKDFHRVVEVPDDSSLIWESGQGTVWVRKPDGTALAAFRGLGSFHVEGEVEVGQWTEA